MCGTCFFIGHRDSPYALQKKLDEVVKRRRVNTALLDLSLGVEETLIDGHYLPS